MSKRKNRQNQKRNVAQVKQPMVVSPMPYILGANFQFGNDIAKYANLIEHLPAVGYKRRILFVGEASYLHTGFSTYLEAVMRRLYATNKFEIGEFGIYGDSVDIEPRVKNIPWKYYHNLPTNQAEAQEYGMVNGQLVSKAYNENQFGKWKFDRVCADFKPDIVFCIADNWMCRYIQSSAFRNNFVWIWMGCLDSFPQKWDWLRDYNKVDHMFTYSYFGKKVLETQSRSPLAQLVQVRPINVVDVCQPGTDPNILRPLDRNEVRKIFNIPPEIRFVGTVMRNQPRKLFPRIIESFYQFKREYPKQASNVYLLLHTSIPDVGWNIPEIVAHYGLVEHVVYSYLCLNCGNIAIAGFQGSPTNCPSCGGKQCFGTPNTKFGFTTEQLNLVYNLMDVYIQGSIAEGDSLPVNEAKSAGVPCLVSDYSALYEKARNGGALPIRNETIYTESETHQWRSLFDRKDLAQKIARLLGNEKYRLILAEEARQCATAYYTWDLCAKKWEYYFETTPIKNRETTWDAPIVFKTPTLDPAPDEPDDIKFIEWLYKNILCRDGVDGQGLQHWLDALQTKKITRADLENLFRKMVEKENSTKKLLLNPNTGTYSEMKNELLNAIKSVEGEL